MSPEQFTNREVDARSDQFSFCVALLEALEGRRPFEGKDFAVVASAVTHGRIRPPPKRHHAPKWIRPIVRRGLAVQPGDRYPSMRELLEALERRTRRPRWMTGLAVVGLMTAVAVTVRATQRTDADAGPCDGVGSEVQAVWNPTKAQEVEGALTSSDLSFARSTWSAVEVDLDRYAAAWSRMRDEACRSALIERSQTEDQHDRRVRCLQRRRRDLASVVDVLVEADAELLPRAPNVVGGLLPLEHCADLEALARDIEPPADPALRQTVAALRGDLDRVRTLRLAGRQQDAVGLAADVAEAAMHLDYAPVLAEALYWRATTVADEGHLDDARRDLVESAAYAQRSGHSDFLASAYIGLIWTATGKGDLELVRMWERWGRAVIARGQGDAMQLSRLEEAVGRFYGDAGDLELAYEHTKTGVELGKGDTPQNVAMALNNLGELTRRLGRLDEAEAHAWSAYQLRRTLLGDDHPHVAMSLLNLGNIAQFRGELETAKTRYREALAIYDRSYGPAHLEAAAAHNNLGLIATTQGETREAIEQLELARRIREDRLGPESPVLVNTLANLGRAYAEDGQHDKAIAMARRAVELAERQLGEGHPGMAWPLSAHAIALVLSGDKAAAMEPARRAVDAATAGLGEDHPERADALLTLGEIAVGHDDAAAREALREALRVFALHDVPKEKLDKTRQLLSQAGG
jgi:tetratricopeptide (TPR) repeat protein